MGFGSLSLFLFETLQWGRWSRGSGGPPRSGVARFLDFRFRKVRKVVRAADARAAGRVVGQRRSREPAVCDAQRQRPEELERQHRVSGGVRACVGVWRATPVHGTGRRDAVREQVLHGQGQEVTQPS